MGCINSSLMSSAFLTGRTNVSYGGSNRWAQRMPPEIPGPDPARSQRTSISSSVYNTESESGDYAVLKKFFYLSSFLSCLEKEQLLKRLEECIINSDLLLLLVTQLTEISDTSQQARNSFERNESQNELLAHVHALDEARSTLVQKYNNCVSKGMEMNNLWEKDVQAAVKTHKALHDQIIEKVDDSDKNSWTELTATRAICRQSLLTAGDGMAVFLKIQTRLRTLKQMLKCSENILSDEERVLPKLLNDSRDSIKNIETDPKSEIRIADLKEALSEIGEHFENNNPNSFDEGLSKAQELVDSIINALWNFYLRARSRFFETNDQIEAALALQRKTYDADVRKKMSVPDSTIAKSDILIPSECPAHDIEDLDLSNDIIDLIYRPLLNELKSERDGNLSVIDEMTEGQPTERIDDVSERVPSADVRKYLETPRPPSRHSSRPQTAETIETLHDNERLDNEEMESKLIKEPATRDLADNADE